LKLRRQEYSIAKYENAIRATIPVINTVKREPKRNVVVEDSDESKGSTVKFYLLLSFDVVHKA
jgi:hypothetical protein